MIKAVIFDLDGTLIDAFDGHAESYDLALKDLGHKPLGPGEFARYYGQTGLEISRQLLKKPFVDGEVEKLTARKHKLYENMGGGHIRALPGAIELIGALMNRKIPMAIASSAVRGAIDIAIKKLGIADKIKFVVSADDITHSKPHPEIFLLAAKKLNVPPENCVVFEDSIHGVLAAKAAGIRCVAVATGPTPRSELEKLKPYRVINSMKELLPKIDEFLKD